MFSFDVRLPGSCRSLKTMEVSNEKGRPCGVGGVDRIRRASSFDARSSGLKPSKNTLEALEAP